MLRTLFYTILLFLSPLQSSGQRNLDSSTTRNVDLIAAKNIKKNKRIPVAENDSFIVYASFNLIVDNLTKFIEEHDVEDDKRLRSVFFNPAKSFERNMQDIENDIKLKERLNFRTADLLEKGQCLVYNKFSKSFESRILITRYWKNWWTGLRFADRQGNVFLDVVTGVF
jgi:hypothetical protein